MGSIAENWGALTTKSPLLWDLGSCLICIPDLKSSFTAFGSKLQGMANLEESRDLVHAFLGKIICKFCGHCPDKAVCQF